MSDNAENENIEWFDDSSVTPVENARRSIASEIAMAPERCLRDWFDTKYDRDILNDEWILH